MATPWQGALQGVGQMLQHFLTLHCLLYSYQATSWLTGLDSRIQRAGSQYVSAETEGWFSQTTQPQLRTSQ